MERLIANVPIMYMGRTYPKGAALPATDPVMVKAWQEAGSASVVDETATDAVATLDGVKGAASMEAVAALVIGYAEATNIPVDEVVADLLDRLEATGAIAPVALAATLDATALEGMKVAELKAMAADMGVTLPSKADKAEIVAILAAVEVEPGEAVEADQEDAETGGQ